MTLPKKKSRVLKHNNRSYRWLVGKRVVRYSGSPNEDGHRASLRLPVAIEECESGAMIHAQFRGVFAYALPSNGFDDLQSLSIKPSDVVRLIDHAERVHGWSDKHEGVLRLDDAQVICPGTIETSSLEALSLSYDSAQLTNYLEDATLIWKSEP